jgi:hypothetical protein
MILLVVCSVWKLLFGRNSFLMCLSSHLCPQSYIGSLYLSILRRAARENRACQEGAMASLTSHLDWYVATDPRLHLDWYVTDPWLAHTALWGLLLLLLAGDCQNPCGSISSKPGHVWCVQLIQYKIHSVLDRLHRKYMSSLNFLSSCFMRMLLATHSPSTFVLLIVKNVHFVVLCWLHVKSSSIYKTMLVQIIGIY